MVNAVAFSVERAMGDHGLYHGIFYVVGSPIMDEMYTLASSGTMDGINHE